MKKQEIQMQGVQIKKKLHDYIDRIEIKRAKKLYQFLEEDIEETEMRISIKQYNEELASSEKEYESGNYKTQKSLEREVKKW
jgi:hypothetical protein